MKCILIIMPDSGGKRQKDLPEKEGLLSGCFYFMLALAQSALNLAMPLSVRGCFIASMST